MPLRQQTMRATLQWSHDLLGEKDQRLFACLAVFVGSFTLEAAEAVGGSISDTGVEDFSVLDGITSLIDHNLLTTREQREDDSRFQMLEVVREFALEALQQSGRKDEIGRLHAEYYCSLGETAEAQLQAAQSSDWLNKYTLSLHDALPI